MKNLHYLLLAIITTFVFSCNSSDNNLTKEQKDSTSTEEPAVQEPIIQELYIGKFTNKLAEGLEYNGKIIHGEAWKDNNNENLLIFTQKEIFKSKKDEPETLTRQIYAYHYTKKDGKFELVREVKDGSANCMHDNRAKLLKKSISITDIDKNGYAEITFAYRLGCSSELSPDILKLIMLENGEKFAIRGNTIVTYDGKTLFGGETNVDESFNNAPESFLTYAKGIWKIYQNPYNVNIVKNKKKKKLLNAENLATHDWKMKQGSDVDALNLVPHTFRFGTTGVLKYIIMEEDWISSEWDMKKYPTIISPLPGQLTFEEGFLSYTVKSKNGGTTSVFYE